MKKYLSVILLAVSVMAVRAEDLTAFTLIKEGDKYVGEQSKDKVVQIRSEKSVASLVPEVWYVVYYDPTATLKAMEVKFGAGKMLAVKRPLRLLEPVTGADRQMDADKLKTDSDQALAIAKKEPMLDNLQLKATQFWLQHSETGPVWKIRFWAAKLSNPNHMADIGDLYVAADTGQIVRNDLHIHSID